MRSTDLLPRPFLRQIGQAAGRRARIVIGLLADRWFSEVRRTGSRGGPAALCETPLVSEEIALAVLGLRRGGGTRSRALVIAADYPQQPVDSALLQSRT